jgi:hypothetical protein
MEFTKYNLNGQWTLCKSDDALDYNDYTGKKSGELPKDHGTKGSLRGGSNKRSQKQMSDHKMEGKTPTPKLSSYAAKNPSLGDASAKENEIESAQ